MRIAEGGIDGWLRREARKVDVMSSMLDVRGPFKIMSGIAEPGLGIR
jgi:hypothetical protein